MQIVLNRKPIGNDRIHFIIISIYGHPLALAFYKGILKIGRAHV